MINFLNIINRGFCSLVKFSTDMVKILMQKNFFNRFGVMLLVSCVIGNPFDADSSIRNKVVVVASTQIRQAAEGLPPEAREYFENMADYLIKALEGEFESNLLKAKTAAAEGAHYLTNKSSTSKWGACHHLKAVACHLISESIISPKKETANHLKSMANHIITIIENFKED